MSSFICFAIQVFLVVEKEINWTNYDENDISDEIEGLEGYETDSVPTSVAQYFLTPLGKRFVEEKLLKVLNATQKDILTVFKERITKMSLKDILGYVYRKYPDYTKNSLIKEKVLGNDGEKAPRT